MAAANWSPWRGHQDLGFLSHEERAAVLAKAAQACRHEFDLLGSGPVHLGDEMDWCDDFKAGYRWPVSIHYWKIRWDTLPPGVDIKVPWELSRCMHFTTLGLADRLSGDPQYYLEFKRQVRHWIAANPYGYGVNWLCPMDVAIRAVNWVHAAMLFDDRIRNDSDDSFFSTMAEALWMAGVHIRRNLEWCGPRSEIAGNHFLANITGLVTLGLFFHNTRRGRGWFSFGKRWMETEIQRQVYPDGCNVETSTSYHRLVMEMFMWSAAICRQAGKPLSGLYHARLMKMADFVASYTSPSGEEPQFGDNDSGRLITAGISDGRDHRYLLDGTSAFGGALDRWSLGGGCHPSAGMATGAFPDGGYWFAGVGAMWGAIRAGRACDGGAHTHCDQLSVVLHVAGQPVLVDRGTGCYTSNPDLRNRLRSTTSHNTPVVNGWEQNGFGMTLARVFSMANDAATEVNVWEHTPGQVHFQGVHQGFSRHRDGMLCRRAVTLRADSMIIVDEVTRMIAGDRIEWFFHLDPTIAVVLESNTAILRRDGLEAAFVLPAGTSCQVEETLHSRCYGMVEPAKVLHVCATVGREGLFTASFEMRA